MHELTKRDTLNKLSEEIKNFCCKYLTGDIPYPERNTTVVLDICSEGNTGNLTCSYGTIKVLSAFYGRMSYTTCNKNPMKTNNCSLDITVKVQAM